MIRPDHKRGAASAFVVCALSTLVLGAPTTATAQFFKKKDDSAESQAAKPAGPEITLTADGASEELQERLRAASSVISFKQTGRTDAQELAAASLADYRTFVQVLYDAGYFGPVVHIRIDGQEAATIPPLNLPSQIKTIAIDIDPGPQFVLGNVSIDPLAPGTELPEGFRSGAPASSRVLRDATAAGISGWKDIGYAKAKVGDQKIVANHRDSRLNAAIAVATGPKLRFGNLTITGNTTVRPEAIRKIAGFPQGEVFSPDDVRTVANRLRRTGTFDTVVLKEAEVPNPDGTLDYTIEVDDRKKRRISFGGELNSRSGVDVSASWTHRNLFGNAERLALSARIANIGGDEDIEGTLGARLELPAKLGPDDLVYYSAILDQQNKTFYDLTHIAVGAGVQRRWSRTLSSEVGVEFARDLANDVFGKRDFNIVSVPTTVTWDHRNDPVNTTNGYFVDAEVRPYFESHGNTVAARAYGDFRYYISPPSDRVVFATRVQAGSNMGNDLPNITPDYLFFSGGAGTVRGQPYQSLGVPANGGTSGGRSLLAGSFEVRTRVTNTWWLVGFYDVGIVGRNAVVESDSPMQSGAGLGIRYELGDFGPIRFDVAAPVDGDTGDGLQFYIGIGQAF
ncbi:autotransporter assembly complex protein TamA [Chachezhania antarctica]|uniref:autotransporter assembly complex protein TamA n=1 Tax=Chachezhania antarctica TaxID=2340860 RepID=UPI000EAD8D63|nr:autotransporter assembly complex family protein [Chachezhania antarctica]|tara:strand:+ start:2343 stop:4211 length:1869 start_codon:yes stop_codon:yes gene_type:complete